MTFRSSLTALSLRFVNLFHTSMNLILVFVSFFREKQMVIR